MERLFELVRTWKTEEIAIIFISHRMGEILRIADRVAVLRNGRTVGDRPIGEVSEAELVNLMVGEEANQRPAAAGHTAAVKKPPRLSDPNTRRSILQVRGLKTDILKGIDFELLQGELLGVGGLQGQGQSDVLKAIFGAIPYSGEIVLEDKALNFRHPSQAMQQGIAFVPGDRAREGLLFRTSILENLLLPSWQKYGLPLKINQARRDAEATSGSLHVVMDGVDMPVSSLSGGNAQKIVIGKWLQRNPQLFLLNDPTKGVDVHAKREFYDLLAQLRAGGTSILLYSSDDDELIGLCDRVVVMYNGEIRAELAGPELNLANLVSASLDAGQEARA